MVVKGTAYWACVHKINDMSDKYQIDVGQLTRADVKMFKELGIEAKKCDKEENNRGYFVTMKSNKPVKVVGPTKEPFLEDVGNGSIVNVAFNPFEWTFKAKKGISAGLQAVQVLKHVPYTQGGVGEFEEADVEETEPDPDDDIPF